MHTPSATPVALLIAAAAVVAVVHSILPDHWVPLAVVARTQRWGLARVARVSALASAGHVLTSVVLGGVIAVIGLQFQREFATQHGHLVGGVLILTGVAFLLWGLTGHGHVHQHEHEHTYGHEHEHEHQHEHEHGGAGTPGRGDGHDGEQPLAGRLVAIAVPFGVAASPDLTILPVALAASAIGAATVVAVLMVFAAVTVATFIGLTLAATVAGYQIKGEWLERHATAVTAVVLVAIGLVAYVGL